MPEEKLPETSRLPNAIEELAKRTGGDWQNLRRAHSTTRVEIEKLRNDLKNLDNEDASIVVFGSLARDEATSDSDTDWTLLSRRQGRHEASGNGAKNPEHPAAR